MAFDMKQLKTCKQLWSIANKYHNVYERSDRFNVIFARFGRFYATNHYMLIYCEWPEYAHCGDDEWMTLDPDGFMDDDGKLKMFDLKPMQPAFSTNDIFERNFICNYNECSACPVDPRLLAMALKVFEINLLNPIVYCDGARYELMAHNRDISVKAIIMGKRR